MAYPFDIVVWLLPGSRPPPNTPVGVPLEELQDPDGDKVGTGLTLPSGDWLPMFDAWAADIARTIDQATRPASGEGGSRLLDFYFVRVRESGFSDALLNYLSGHPAVAQAYRAPRLGRPPSFDNESGDDDLFVITGQYPDELGYLWGEDPHHTIGSPATSWYQSTRWGVDARAAWAVEGGRGQGIGLTIFERGWALKRPGTDLVADHSDLPNDIALLPGFSDQDWEEHGIHTLGIIKAKSDSSPKPGLLLNGIAPECGPVRLAPSQLGSGIYTADLSLPLAGNVLATVAPARGKVTWTVELREVLWALLHAVDETPPGDVLLLEVQLEVVVPPATSAILVPMEYDLICYHILQYATGKTSPDKQLIVIEPAGNNDQDLDTIDVLRPTSTTDLVGSTQKLTSAWRTDAWMVSGVDLKLKKRHNNLNYGSAVRFFAWGEYAKTLHTGVFPTTNFDGTSSAAAIVAGAAVCAQAIYLQKKGVRATASQLLPIMLHQARASADPPVDRVGVMPNLRGVLLHPTMDAAPEVYIRDNRWDSGAVPSHGRVWRSPDIMVLPAPLSAALPTAAKLQGYLGEGTPAENKTLLVKVKENKKHHVVLRLRNKGGNLAKEVGARVFYSKPSTLLTPSSWKNNVVGTVTLEDVPGDDSLRVTGAFEWDTTGIVPGSYCFIIIVGTAAQPLPDPDHDFPTITSLETFSHYVRNNAQVAWRNFNFVPVKLPIVFVPEPPVIDLEVDIGLLPETTTIELVGRTDVPLIVDFEAVDQGEAGHGRSPLREARKAARFHGEALVLGHTPGRPEVEHVTMRLIIRPEEPGANMARAQLTLRQRHGGLLLGEVTWRFLPEEELEARTQELREIMGYRPEVPSPKKGKGYTKTRT